MTVTAAASKLRKLRIGELSLVNRPANQGAESLLHKTDDPDDKAPSLLQKFMSLFSAVDKGADGVDLTAPEAVMGSMTLALHTAVDSIMADDSLTDVEKVAKFDETVEQYRDAVLALPQFPQSESIMAEKDTNKPVEKSAEVLKAEADAREAITKANTERDAAVAKLAEHTTAVNKAARTTMAKSLVEKTNVDQPSVEILLEKCEGDEKATTALKTILGKNAAAIKEGQVLEEVGKTVDTKVAAPVAKLQKLADEIQKANPKLSGPQAFSKAMELNPELYEESLAPAAQ